MITNEMELGLVASHSRPGSNVTGLLMRVDGMVGKQLEMAAQIVPGAKRVGVLFNGASVDASTDRQEAQAASSTLGVSCIFADARTPDQLDSAFRHFVDMHVDAVVVLYNSLFFQERRPIANLALASRLPGIYAARDHVKDGGLISYGINLRSSARRMTTYIDKIFKGAQAGDLPLEFPNKLELVINLTTAKALGLTVSPALIARADEVIE